MVVVMVGGGGGGGWWYMIIIKIVYKIERGENTNNNYIQEPSACDLRDRVLIITFRASLN